ncbi:MAG: right-handed parallel beta-helix repeat-containing protein, partial [Candidatus Paceibacterota bacterium]
ATGNTANSDALWIVGSNNNTIIGNDLKATGNAGKGIYLQYTSLDNVFANNTANATVWDFYSAANSTGNIVTNLTLAGNTRLTSVSFTGKDAALKSAAAPIEGIPADSCSLNRWINATNNSADSWLNLNISYAAEDIGGCSGYDDLSMWQYKTGWTNLTSSVNGEGKYINSNINTSTLDPAIFGLLSKAVAAGTCNCTNCTTCTAALNNESCATVLLTADIADHAGTCIDNPANFSNKTFDCQGNTIDGDHSAGNGITLNGKNNSTIQNCVITDFAYGIFTQSSSYINITNNSANSNSYDGINLYFSSDNFILSNNTFSGNDRFGMYGSVNSYNRYTNNTASGNFVGMLLETSISTIMRNNNLTGNIWNFQISGISVSEYYEDIDISNTVDGKPIYYYNTSCSNFAVPSDAGFVALISCDNATVENEVLANNSHGILLVNTNNSLIQNNSIEDTSTSSIAISFDSNNNSILGNNMSHNFVGIYLLGSNGNNVTSNTVISGSGTALYVDTSMNNTMAYNNVSYNGNDGIYLLYSSGNNVTNNSADYNGGMSISVWEGANNNVDNNTINYNLGSMGIAFIGPTAAGGSVSGNRACGASTYDIWLEASSSGYSGDNTCDIFLDEDSNSVGCSNTCTPASVCNCTDCATCTAALSNASCTTVQLTADITNGAGRCIDDPVATNKTFDCQGHTIEGTGSGYGIVLSRHGAADVNDTIKNCIINGPTYGIYFDGPVYSSTIINNTITNTGVSVGIVCDSSWIDRNTTTNITNNTMEGLYISWCNNNVIDKNTMTWASFDYAEDTVITNNAMNSPGYYVVSATGSSRAQIAWNNMSGRGISITDSVDMNFTENNMTTNVCYRPFNVYGSTLAHFTHTFGTDNICNGLPIDYRYGLSDTTVYEDADISGTYNQVICAYCDNVLYDNVTMGGHGISFFDVNDSKIISSNVTTDDNIAVYVNDGYNNNITENDIYDNSGCGTVFVSGESSALTYNDIYTYTNWGLTGIVINGNYTNASGNTINATGALGSVISIGANATFDNNTLDVYSGSQIKGILVGSNSVISNNDMEIESWDGQAIYLGPWTGTVEGVLITNNNIRMTGNYRSDYIIYLSSHSGADIIDNDFTIHDISGDGNSAWVVYMDSSTVNNFTGNNITGPNGVKFVSNSNSNNMINNTFNNTGTSVYIEDDGDNTFLDDVISDSTDDTKISFGDYDGAFTLSKVTSPPADPEGRVNISKYIDITNLTEASIDINISYNDSEIGDISEETLSIWGYSGGTWGEVSGSTVDTENDIVTAHIDNPGKIFAPLGNRGSCPLGICGGSFCPYFVNGDWTFDENVSCDGTALIINASDITIECAGYAINYSAVSEGFGINITGFDNVTIKNCTVQQTINISSANNHAVYADNSNGITVEDSIITPFDYGAASIVFFNLNSGMAYRNTLNTRDDTYTASGIYLANSSNNSVENNTINAEGDES